MIQKEILDREEKNYNKIYLYVDAENELCHAYNFSAYQIRRLFEAQMLEMKELHQKGIVHFIVKFPLQFMSEFDDDFVRVSDQFIEVTMDNLPRCFKWKMEFEALAQQRQSSIKAKKKIWGFFRFG